MVKRLTDEEILDAVGQNEKTECIANFVIDGIIEAANRLHTMFDSYELPSRQILAARRFEEAEADLRFLRSIDVLECADTSHLVAFAKLLSRIENGELWPLRST